MSSFKQKSKNSSLETKSIYIDEAINAVDDLRDLYAGSGGNKVVPPKRGGSAPGVTTNAPSTTNAPTNALSAPNAAKGAKGANASATGTTANDAITTVQKMPPPSPSDDFTDDDDDEFTESEDPDDLTDADEGTEDRSTISDVMSGSQDLGASSQGASSQYTGSEGESSDEGTSNASTSQLIQDCDLYLTLSDFLSIPTKDEETGQVQVKGSPTVATLLSDIARELSRLNSNIEAYLKK